MQLALLMITEGLLVSIALAGANYEATGWPLQEARGLFSCFPANAVQGVPFCDQLSD